MSTVHSKLPVCVNDAHMSSSGLQPSVGQGQFQLPQLAIISKRFKWTNGKLDKSFIAKISNENKTCQFTKNNELLNWMGERAHAEIEAMKNTSQKKKYLNPCSAHPRVFIYSAWLDF